MAHTISGNGLAIIPTQYYMTPKLKGIYYANQRASLLLSKMRDIRSSRVIVYWKQNINSNKTDHFMLSLTNFISESHNLTIHVTLLLTNESWRPSSLNRSSNMFTNLSSSIKQKVSLFRLIVFIISDLTTCIISKIIGKLLLFI